MTDRLQKLYDLYLESSGISIDTRKIKPGNIFFALGGPNFDGNKYAKQALDNGAALAVIDNPDLSEGSRMFLVEDCLSTLQDLASLHRSHFKKPIFAITGSNGKTTTKELMSLVLSTKFNVHATSGNLNNHIGVPLTLLSMSLDADMAIIEMGANHMGEIASYCQIARPTHGLITNIGSAHLGEFGGKENLIRAKSELFDFLRKTDGVVFINKEDEVLFNMAKRFVSPKFFPDEHAVLIDSNPYVKYRDEESRLHQTHLVGTYNFLNLSSALSAGSYFDVDVNSAYKAIDNYQPENNRSQILTLGSNTIILDAYNANPDSTKAALDNLCSFRKLNKVAMLGDMKELGNYSREEHSGILSYIKNRGIDLSFFVGPEYQEAIGANRNIFENVEGLISYLKEQPISNSAVLIKGSRSMVMEKLTTINEIWI